jgi:hypothetical protein
LLSKDCRHSWRFQQKKLTKTLTAAAELFLVLIESSSSHFWPSFTTEDYWPSAVLNLVIHKLTYDYDLRQKKLFFPIAEGGAKIFGVFRVKNHDPTPKKNHIFSNFRGARSAMTCCSVLWLKFWSLTGKYSILSSMYDQ